jgi:hypothetical protein
VNDFHDEYNWHSKGENVNNIGVVTAVIGSLGLIATTAAAWVTHVVVCIKASAWILLIFGIVVPPIGFIHGFGSWFGWF